MAGIWIYSDNAVVAAQLLTPGKELAEATGNQLRVFIDEESVAEDLIGSGADIVYIIKSQDNRSESAVAFLAQMIRLEKPQAVLFGGTLRGKEIAARCAAIVEAGLTTDASAIRFVNNTFETDRMVYGGLAVSTEMLTEPALILVSPNLFIPPDKDASRRGEVLTREVGASDGIIVKENSPIDRGAIDLAATEKIVCVGRGMSKKVDLEMVEKLAQVLGAEVGCTRPITENKFMPIERYIGISGVKVKPRLYIGLGVSGQIQHLAGIQDSKVIIAVDSNENAPIFAAADYGIVGDLYEVTPLLIEALEK